MKFRTRNKYRQALLRRDRLSRIASHRRFKAYTAGRKAARFQATQRMTGVMSWLGFVAQIRYTRGINRITACLRSRHYKRAGLSPADYASLTMADIIKIGALCL